MSEMLPGELELRVYGFGTIGAVPKGVYLVLAVLFVVGTLLLLWRNGLREGWRYSMLLLLAEWVFLILGICLLFRESDAERSISLIPFSSYFVIAENTYFLEKAAL